MVKYKKKKFEWKHRVLDDGQKENALFIDGEYFDWEVDKSNLAQAFDSGDPKIIKQVKRSVEASFLECLSEVVGRKLTQTDIQNAEQTGWI